jgi:hypothetical protein
MADLTMEERLEVVRAQLAEVQRVQGQVGRHQHHRHHHRHRH